MMSIKIWITFFPLCYLKMLLNSVALCFFMFTIFRLDVGHLYLCFRVFRYCFLSLRNFICFWQRFKLICDQFDHLRFVLCLIRVDLVYSSSSLYSILTRDLFRFLKNYSMIYQGLSNY